MDLGAHAHLVVNLVQLLIPKDLPWLFPYRARWVVGTWALFGVAWTTGVFASLSSPFDDIPFRDPFPGSLVHGFVFGIAPAGLAIRISKLSSTRLKLVLTFATVLLWLVGVRYFVGKMTLISYE